MQLRVLAWAAAGLVVGFVLGGVPARQELATLRKEYRELERRLADRDRPNFFDALLPQLAVEPAPTPAPAAGPAQGTAPPAPVTGSREALPIDEPQEKPPGSGSVAVIGERPSGPEVPGLPRGAASAEGVSPADAPPVPFPPSRLSPKERQERRRAALERFDSIVTAQRARGVALRSHLITAAGLDDAQVAEFDSVTERVNGKLMGYGEEVVDRMLEPEPPKPAAALSLGHDVSGILLEGQNELDAIVGEAGEQVDPQAMEIWSYVDLEQWKPFVDQQLQGRAGAPGAPSSEAAGSGAKPPTPAASEE